MSLIFNHVNHIYSANTPNEVQALEDINLEIEKGEFICLIGHTGSGKSTLVQHMNGLLHPSSGQIFFDGQDISEKGFDMKTFRSKVGLVFQYPEHQLFESSVIEDVSFGPKNLGLSKLEIEKRACEALTLVGFPEDLWDSSPFELSGGQKRCVAIAGVLAMKPEIFVLDEPTAGLDPKTREDILGLISRLCREQHITVVLVSHSMEDVAQIADRILVMHRGRIVMNDTPGRVFERYKELEPLGLSAPQVTYVLSELKEKGYPVNLQAVTIDQAAEEIYAALSHGMN